MLLDDHLDRWLKFRSVQGSWEPREVLLANEVFLSHIREQAGGHKLDDAADVEQCAVCAIVPGFAAHQRIADILHKLYLFLSRPLARAVIPIDAALLEAVTASAQSAGVLPLHRKIKGIVDSGRQPVSEIQVILEASPAEAEEAKTTASERSMFARAVGAYLK